MNGKKIRTTVSRLLAAVMLLCVFPNAMAFASADTAAANPADPYFREDPGPGKVPVEIAAPTNEWATAAPLDARVPADFAGGTYEMIPYPFADSEGKADVLRINYAHNGTSTFGGLTLTSPLSSEVDIPEGSTVEFDVYYPKSAQGKYMRWRIRTTGPDLDSYLRGYDYTNLNPAWVGSYEGETWLVTHHSVTSSTGTTANLIMELHGETSRPEETGVLLVSNIIITAPDPEGIALEDVVNSENQSVVRPLKDLYNEENGLFMVGAIGTGAVTGTRARHYEIFVDGNNLKAESTHPRGPSWLVGVDGEALNGATTFPGLREYSFPTAAYQAIRDSGLPGEYKNHAHVLAWYNQAPAWMRQIVPANLESGYTGTAEFYGLGNGVTDQVPVDKDMARRVQFNHTMYVMRHFLTTDMAYGSSEARRIIPFNSWDVLNEEIHESRHSELIPEDINNWRTSLKHTNWLAAISDDLISGDITEHYIYLLFKYAHIAAPNARMAEAYKENYADLPEYMKLDGHDTNGSIDAYVLKNPPKLVYNDYGIASRSKARTVYNMLLELNTAWLSDPLYDGRPLIEDMGIQGHDTIGSTLASENQYAMALFASLIDQGLLSGISFSEFDLNIPTSAPGGGATAPAVLNVRQSDALGYQYALMYKLFTKFAPYIDHIISWGVSGSGWGGAYVLFDADSNANAGYYGAMDPDRFIAGHSYLDYYFEGEYEKLQDGYEIDLGDVGVFVPKK
jgi:GH35 family endo-1,4-beta-xylanase